MGSAKQRISGALILTLGASMLVGCELPERNTQVKSIKIGVTLYDQYDAFLSELMEHLCSSEGRGDRNRH